MSDLSFNSTILHKHSTLETKASDDLALKTRSQASATSLERSTSRLSVLLFLFPCVEEDRRGSLGQPVGVQPRHPMFFLD